MGATTIIAALQMASEHVVNGSTDDTIIEKRTFGRKAVTVLEAHQSVENNINRNESLSQQGKLESLKRLGTNETAPAFKWIRNVIKEKQEKDQRLQSQFYQIDSGIKDLAERTPKFVYLWGKLDMLDPNERIKQFLQAAEQDQVVILSAMLENPFGPMINEDVKQRGLVERAKRLFPRDYENFEQNAILLEFLVTFRDWIARWLNQEVGVDIAVIRTNFGDEVADMLKHQVTGIPQRQDAA